MLADISNVDAIYIVCGRTDMRKSIDGLCAIIKEQFSLEIDHALYLFCGRKCDRIKGFLSWLDKQSPVRGSRMDKAVTYIQNRRSYLTTYLEDGRCSFSKQ